MTTTPIPDNAQITSTTRPMMDSLLLGHNSDWWNAAMVVSLGFAALVALLVAAATTGVIVVQKREAMAAESELGRYKLTVAGKIAEAQSAGIAAGRAAGDADARAARAELELAKLKEPRHFTPDKDFVPFGKQYLSGKRFDLSAGADIEPMMLALEIRDALTSIGMTEQVSSTKEHWTPPGGGMPIGAIVRPGIAIRSCESPVSEPSKPTVARLLAALLADGGLGTKDAPVFLEPWEKSDCQDLDLLHIEIGSKIVTPWHPRPGASVVYPKFSLSVPNKD